MLQVYCSKCFNCFRRILHMFYLGVEYVSHIYCNCFIQMFHMFHTYVLSVSSGCCIYFAMATHVFPGVSDVCCKYFNCFGRMLQVLSRCYKSRSVVAHITVKLICSTHLLQWLGTPIYAWMWRGPSVGHRMRAGYGVEAGHGVGTRHEAAGPT
jgi:hypothetical protein